MRADQRQMLEQYRRDRLNQPDPWRDIETPLIGYAKEIRWTRFDGGVSSVGVQGCQTKEDAERKAWDFAISSGWTPRRWWQWWRWGDTPNPPRHQTAPRGTKFGK